jgi:putative endonuclease
MSTAVVDSDLGARGEQAAADYLESHGLVVLSQNWRCREGELDLVATDRDRLIVCEVKTRSSPDHGEPEEFVDRRKIMRIQRATYQWLRKYRVGWCDLRFDIVSVLWPPNESPRIRHLKGAF